MAEIKPKTGVMATDRGILGLPMIRVRIPATTANLGPAFDCMGLALDLWNEFELVLTGEAGDVTVETVGEGAAILPKDRRHLVAATMLDEVWPGMIPTDRGIRLTCRNAVPCASGLGSSSTAVLAGLIFASALSARAVHGDDPARVLAAVNDPANRARVLRRAIQLEGHGDNVAPALLGGLIMVVPGEGEPVVRKVDFAPLRVAVCVPDYRFLTKDARAALPGDFSKEDTIYNVGHALLVADALRTGDLELLSLAMGDRVHEPYRMPLIPGAVEARQAALTAGARAACLSGAGPGMLALASEGHNAIGQAMADAFAARGLRARWWALNAIEHGTEIEA